ncbi:MAG: dipeptide/oligopeptide/nickel ABC transporter ATP-binding protein, partial [Treponema sp.]|nr:dipeptide/oligopeptide/nickel ABC transporter ATP-binding protein [Treponema sp.]
MRRFLKYLGTRPIGMASLVILVLLYLTMIFAEYIAPYSPNTSFPDKSYHPPNAQFYQGKLQAQEMRVINSVTWNYAWIRGQYDVIHFSGKGEPYLLCGVIPLTRHLFSTEPGAYPIFLMGADNLGRDIFSRIIYGSRISLTIGFVAT